LLRADRSMVVIAVILSGSGPGFENEIDG
jgi:hypothetical protein